MDLARMRLEYETAGLDVSDLADDPLAQFDRWFKDAVAAEVYEPNAMVVSTVDAAGRPWSRHLLLKGVTDGGFDFYTNYESNKSTELETNSNIALTFGWLPLHRQVNIGGVVSRVPAEESDAYWAVRTRGSQIGGWASAQSRELGSRAELTSLVDEIEERFPGEVPRPPHWGGWRVVPHTIEFWQGRQNRLHDRLRYVQDDGSGWRVIRLAP